jgi:hypothetical protein
MKKYRATKGMNIRADAGSASQKLSSNIVFMMGPQDFRNGNDVDCEIECPILNGEGFCHRHGGLDSENWNLGLVTSNKQY